MRVSIERGRPFGEDKWVKRTASVAEVGAHHSSGGPATQAEETSRVPFAPVRSQRN